MMNHSRRSFIALITALATAPACALVRKPLDEPPFDELGVISGTVFSRTLRFAQGVRDMRQPHVGVYMIRLHGGSQVFDTKTNEAGNYYFFNVKPGTYLVKAADGTIVEVVTITKHQTAWQNLFR